MVSIKWLSESNRTKHLLYAIPIAIVFTILCVLGVATALEFKDKQYGNTFDWLDWLATMIGGVIGQIIQVLIFILIYQTVYK